MNLAEDELRFAADEAADLLEFGLFLRTELMRVLAVCIKLRMSGAKLLVGVGGQQVEMFVELIPHEATWGLQAFRHRQSHPAVFDGGLLTCVLDGQCLVQITAGKQQAKPLLGDAHAVNLKLGPRRFGRSAKHPVRIENDQGGLMIAIADSRGHNLLATIAVEVGQGQMVQMPGMPVLSDGFTIGIEDRDLIGPPGIVDT